MIFSGLLGACVMYTAVKFRQNLDLIISALAAYFDNICI